ncbi:MFS transporter [Streptomyces roseoviridis]|uniref:MFS transporter n=1 Tax=Streptomyces roseoviridis TaxID=67361 RepID=A0ABV5QGZ3_9ACTN
MTATAVPPTGAAPEPEVTWDARQWSRLLVLSGNMLLDAIEVSVILIALPTLAARFGLTPWGAQWMMSGFALGFAALLLLGPVLCARLGRRRAYLGAMLLFGAASLAGGLAGGPALLVAVRVVKGCCAALTAPTGLAIINDLFPEGPERRRALSVYSLFGAAGFTAGLLLAGGLLEADWRWVFVFPAPVALVLLVAGAYVLPREGGGPGGDGAPAGGGAVAGPGPGDGDAGARSGDGGPAAGPGAGTGGGAADSGAPAHRPGARLPSLALLKRGPLLRSALGAASLNGTYQAVLVVMVFQMADDFGWSPWLSALALLPACVPLALTVPFAGRFIARHGSGRLVTLGALFPLLGYGLYLARPDSGSYPLGMLPVLLLVEAGFCCAFVALNTQATAGLDPADRGAAVSLYQAAVQLGAAVLLPAAALLLTHATGPRPALVLITAVGALGLVAALARRGAR